LKKLAIITTHPIQYNAPFFKMLSERQQIKIKVFYTWSQTEKEQKYDPGFGKNIDWDIPLLEGYDYTFSKNTSTNPGSGSFNGILNPNLIKEITEWKPNAILVYGWSFKSHLKVLFHFKNKVPILFRGDSTLLDEQKGLKVLIRRFWLKYVYSKINFAMYVGEANKNYFLAHGLKERQLHFMPHAIDNNRFTINEKLKNKASDLRGKLSIPDKALVFLFVGKLEVKKQPKLLLNAFKQFNVDSHLVFVGSGILESDLKILSKDVNNIHFLGFKNQTEMPLMYAIADVFVLPSSGPGETWGLAINEAMAAGKAILASDACGAVYNLIDGNGFIFNKKNEKDLLDKLNCFMSNNVKQFGTRSLELISKYTFKSECEIIENLMSKIEL
jgi:glycosyltransferase involved in cell wall biosynthesis